MKILNHFYRQREKRRLIDLRRILILTVVAFLVWRIGAIGMRPTIPNRSLSTTKLR